MNPVAINSANILNFGFTAVFKLFDRKITFDVSTLTTYVSGNAGNVLGIFIKVVDPTGIVIKDIDLTASDIDPVSPNPFDVIIPNANFGFGWWILTAEIQDEDSVITVVTIKKNVCAPEGFNGKSVDGSVNALINCYTPSVRISETTPMTYTGKKPVTVVKDGNLYYPQGTADAVPFTFTPFAIVGANQVYTGDYLVKNTSTAIYDLEDNVTLEIKYITSYRFSVNCNSNLGSVLCCIKDLQTVYNNSPQSEKGQDAKDKLQKISIPLNTALLEEKLGQDSTDEVEQIKKILNCDCNCNDGLVEPMALGVDDNNPVILQFTQAGGVTIDSATVGNTTNYTISTKIVQVTKDSGDLNFSITTTQSEFGVLYTIAFDYVQLAETILNTIGADEDLINLLKSIIEGADAGIDLSGLANNCIISLTNCNYLLVEANNVVKTITSIKIDGTTHNAPGGLLLTNVSAIATWLNGLSLGTFSVNLDGGSNTVSITSNANSHSITTFIFTIGGNPTTRQFSRTCTNLTDVLNAICAYVCALDGTKIKFGATGIQINTLDSNLNIGQQNIASYASLTGVLNTIITAYNNLVGIVAGIGFTCATVKTLFQAVDKALLPTDGVLGIKGGSCALMAFDEMFQIILTNASTDVKSMLCALSQDCAGPVCSPATNVSATFASGTLTVNANGVGNLEPIKIFYRINNSGLTFTELDGNNGGDLPVPITSLDSAQYEVQIQKQCSNGVWSPLVSAVSNNACPAPVSFGVVISGSNFEVSATLTSPQTKIEVTMTDPNNGVSTTLVDLSGVSGTFTIAIPAGLYGNYNFKGRAVCDESATPIFASVFTNTVTVNNANPASNNIFASASYGMVFTDISNGTATGIPASFNSTSIPANKSDYTASLTAGTISVTMTGTIPPGFPIYLRLVKNGSTILSQVTIGAAGTFTLTNPSTINAPDLISIEIDS